MAESEHGDGPESGTPTRAEDLFRAEALAHHLGEAEEGDVLRLPPRWTRWTFPFLTLVVCAAAAWLALGSAPVYRSGPAVLRVDSRMTLAAPTAGAVERVAAQPGDRVEAGAALVRFRADRERADLEKVRQDWELQMVEHLTDLGDEVAARGVRSLTAELERLRSALEQRTIRAPEAGVVSDVRIRPGQFLAAGDPVLSLVPAEAAYTVVALLPGQARPLIEPGMPVRVEIVGYPYDYLFTKVRRVGDQVIGPSEARRFLGAEIADTVGLAGPVVLVEGELASDTFHSGGRTYGLYDGMLARAEVRVRTERLIYLLLPGLKSLGSDA